MMQINGLSLRPLESDKSERIGASLIPGPGFYYIQVYFDSDAPPGESNYILSIDQEFDRNDINGNRLEY